MMTRQFVPCALHATTWMCFIQRAAVSPGNTVSKEWPRWGAETRLCLRVFGRLLQYIQVQFSLFSLLISTDWPVRCSSSGGLPYCLFSSLHSLSPTTSPSWVPDTWCEMSSITDSLGSSYCFPFGLLTLWIAQQFFMLVILTLRFKVCWLFFIANLATPIHLLPFSAQFSAFEALVGVYWGFLLAGFRFGSTLEETFPASMQSLTRLLHPSLWQPLLGHPHQPIARWDLVTEVY